MFAFDEYALVCQRQEDMLKQAAYERLARASQNGRGIYGTLVLWLGAHMVAWGQKLEHVGTVKAECSSASLNSSIDV